MGYTCIGRQRARAGRIGYQKLFHARLRGHASVRILYKTRIHEHLPLVSKHSDTGLPRGER